MEIKNGIEIHSYDGAGYMPLIDFESWRVALLNPAGSAAGIDTMQRHLETDEVFILLTGKCVLFAAADGEKPEHVSGVSMEPLKLYNVTKGYWHASALTDGASVLIVENRDTTAANSPQYHLCDEMKNQIAKISEELLK